MEMTIDYCINYFESTIDELAKEGQYCDVFEMSVATMRKYQKIEDIYYHQRGEALENSLRAVIEDGIVD